MQKKKTKTGTLPIRSSTKILYAFLALAVHYIKMLLTYSTSYRPKYFISLLNIHKKNASNYKCQKLRNATE
jgi:hypothetical protein